MSDRKLVGFHTDPDYWLERYHESKRLAAEWRSKIPALRARSRANYYEHRARMHKAKLAVHGIEVD